MLRGVIPVNQPWNVMIDLFIARDIETIRSQQQQLRKEEEQEREAIEGVKAEEVKPVQATNEEDW